MIGNLKLYQDFSADRRKRRIEEEVIEEYCRSYIDQHETDYPIRNCRPLEDPSFGFVLDCSEEKNIGSVGCYALIKNKNKNVTTIKLPATYKPYGHFL